MSSLLHTLASVGFNWHIALANFVNFLLVFFVLYTLVFKKLAQAIEARSKKIEQGLDNAAEGKHLLSRAHKEVEEIIKDAENKKSAIMIDGEAKGIALAKALEKEALLHVEEMKAKIAQEKLALQDTLEKEWKDISPALLISLFEKTIKKTVNKETNDAFVQALSQ